MVSGALCGVSEIFFIRFRSTSGTFKGIVGDFQKHFKLDVKGPSQLSE